MPYCPECGNYHEVNDSTCSSCGRSFAQEHIRVEDREAKQIIMHKRDAEGDHFIMERVRDNLNGRSFNDGLPSDLGIPIRENHYGFTGGNSVETNSGGPSIRLNEESQLGKGLIKPNSVEIGIDGFHFKYEKPLGNFVKAEPISNKVLEYRSKNDEPESNSVIEDILIKDSPNMAIVDQSAPEEAGNESTYGLLDLEKPEPLISGDLPGEGGTASMDTETLLEEFILSQELPFTESEIEQFELKLDEPVHSDEPELTLKTEYEILWEGYQTFLGFPLQDSYRLSNRSLLISNRRFCRYSEVDLVLFTDVKLKQNWFDRLFGVGDVIITVKDLQSPGLVLSKIKQPEKVFQMIQDLIKAQMEPFSQEV